ncbi:hypothetical protein DFH11DRAFT_1616418 [Phellopilus nigrolimitatus]|nr:hypothetical protein DFH11DRAFT_1616418 [Phellopilus nigrolimitatus]
MRSRRVGLIYISPYVTLLDSCFTYLSAHFHLRIMPLVLPGTEDIKRIRSSREMRERALAKRAATADVAQRVVIGGHGSRSADSRRSKENDTGGIVTGKKRKAGFLEEGPKPAVAGTSQTHSRTGRQRKHKVAKYATSISLEAGDAGPTRDVSTQSHRFASFTDDEAPSKIEKAPMINARSTQRPRSLSRAVQPTGSTRGALEVEDLKQEVVGLQKEAELARKSAADQMQAIEDLKRELAATKKMSRKQGNQIDKLKTSGKKSEDLLATIQETLQCQICLDLLLKPFALSPCGHVLCQGCLQEWFRNAPKRANEDDLDEIPTIYRIKTCPCCRSEIYSRPVPLFIIRNLVASFATEAQSSSTAVFSDIDPWMGIFPLDSELTDEELESDEDHYDSDADSASSIDARYLGLRIFSDGEDNEDEEMDSEDDESDLNMVLPAWAPAFYRANVTRRAHPNVSQEHLELLQRGATLQMIERFRMRLDREEGIVAWANEGTEVYLGWNIALPDDDHADGRVFMAWVDSNTMDYPESWLFDETVEDHVVYRRLVPEEMETEILGPGEESDDEL